MHHRLHTLLVVALVASASACTGFTGVKGSKKISELSEGERQEVCENTAAHFEEEIGADTLKRYGCVVAASITVPLSGGGLPECEAAVDLCLMEATIDDGMDTCNVDGAPSCEATIEEYEACMDERLAGLKSFYSAYTCEALFSGGSGLEQPMPGPECMALSQKCPDLFSTTGEGA